METEFSIKLSTVKPQVFTTYEYCGVVQKENGPAWSLFKVSSSRKGELETRASLDLPASWGP